MGFIVTMKLRNIQKSRAGRYAISLLCGIFALLSILPTGGQFVLCIGYDGHFGIKLTDLEFFDSTLDDLHGCCEHKEDQCLTPHENTECHLDDCWDFSFEGLNAFYIIASTSVLDRSYNFLLVSCDAFFCSGHTQREQGKRLPPSSPELSLGLSPQVGLTSIILLV